MRNTHILLPWSCLDQGRLNDDNHVFLLLRCDVDMMLGIRNQTNPSLGTGPLVRSFLASNHRMDHLFKILVLVRFTLVLR